VALLDSGEVTKRYGADDRLFVVRVPRESELAGRTLGRTRLTDVFDFKVLATFRDANLELLPGPDTELAGGDLLLIQGEPEDLDVLRALQGLDLDSKPSMKLSSFESRRLAMQDATLDPRSSLVGKSVAELNFRERYGLELVGIWRNGAPVEEDLRDVRLALGDALLLVGPREKLELLERDPDFLVLTPLGKAPPDTRRAPVAAGIMLGVVTSVLAGWLPIQIAAVFGATLMVLTGCLNMEQAYRAIEWRAIFLIAGMLPLGTAMQETGAAAWIAGQVLSVTGDAGPWPVIFSLYAMTAVSTVVIPPAVLVVIMAPIVLSAMADMGLAPETAMMAMAVAAAASFMSPISHPANILVMGPGGYRFADYLRVGVPLTLVVFVVVMIVLPFIWPLQPA
jgi:di/tricarboxylate transporter